MSSPGGTAPRARARLSFGAAALLGLLGASAPAASGPRLLAFLAWIGLLAPALGAWLGGRWGASGRLGTSAVVAAWIGAALLLRALDPPSRAIAPGGAAFAATLSGALLLGGFGLGARAPRLAPTLAGGLALVALAAALVPLRGALVEPTWAQLSPRAASILLDLSPWTWVAESAGVDWMRHPAVYGPAGTEWFSDVRRPYAAVGEALRPGKSATLKALAAPAVLLMGALLGWTAAGARAPSGGR